jgi:hypothetical protein
LQRVPNRFGDGLLGSAGVDHHAAIGLARRNREIGFPQLFVEFGALPFKPVRLNIAAAQLCPLEAKLNWQVEDHRDIGGKTAD